MSLSKRIDDIEVLRAVAVLLTIIQHLPALFTWQPSFYKVMQNYFSFGCGVDLFFVISGFVIAKDLLVRLGETHIVETKWRVLIAFWIRRAWRIFPTAWFWVLVTLLAVVGFNDSGTWGIFHSDLNDAITVLTQTENIHFLQHISHGTVDGLDVYWTLSLEEQFYIVLPFLLLLSLKRAKVILLAIFFTQLLMLAYSYNMRFCSFAPFIMGVFLAIGHQRKMYYLIEPVFLKNTLMKILTFFLLILSLVVIAAGQALPSFPTLFMIEVIAFLLVFIASYNANYIFPKGIVYNILTWVGTRSYAIYLIHLPAFFFARELWFRLQPPLAGHSFSGHYTLRFLLVAIAFIAIFSELNYRLIETPFRRRGKEIADRFVQANLPFDKAEKENIQALPVV